MAFKIGHGINAVSGSPICAMQCKNLSGHFRTRDAAPASDEMPQPRITARIDVAAPPLLHGASAPQIRNPRRARILTTVHRSPASFPGQRAKLGKSCQFKWIQTKVNAAGQRHINVASLQRRTGIGNGQQAGSACAVHYVTAAFKIKVIADPAGNRVGKTAGQRLFGGRWKRAFVKRFDLGEQADVISGELPSPFWKAALITVGRMASASASGWRARTLRSTYCLRKRRCAHAGRCCHSTFQHPKGLFRNIQGQPVGKVGGEKSLARDPKTDAIKFVVFKHCCHRYGNSVFALLRCRIIRQIQAQARNAAERAPLRQHVLPQFTGERASA